MLARPAWRGPMRQGAGRHKTGVFSMFPSNEGNLSPAKGSAHVRSACGWEGSCRGSAYGERMCK